MFLIASHPKEFFIREDCFGNVVVKKKTIKIKYLTIHILSKGKLYQASIFNFNSKAWSTFRLNNTYVSQSTSNNQSYQGKGLREKHFICNQNKSTSNNQSYEDKGLREKCFICSQNKLPHISNVKEPHFLFEFKSS